MLFSVFNKHYEFVFIPCEAYCHYICVGNPLFGGNDSIFVSYLAVQCRVFHGFPKILQISFSNVIVVENSKKNTQNMLF